MGELLGKERTPKEIEAGLDGIGALVNLHHAITDEQCPRHLAVGMATSAVSSLQFRCRALEAERDEKAGVAEVYYNTMTSYENDNRELRARLREAEAERDQWKEDYDLAQRGLIARRQLQGKAVEAFRVRAIEAMRVLPHLTCESTAIELLQSLPATSEQGEITSE